MDKGSIRKRILLKDKFREICKNYNIPLFLTDYWMDSVCDNNWDVILYEENDTLIAFFVFKFRQRLGMTIIENPILTPFSGFYFLESHTHLNSLTQNKKNEILKQLIVNLPRFSKFSITFNRELIQLLPLKWMGFSLGIRYSQELQLVKDFDIIQKSFSSKARQTIKKAQLRYEVVNLSDSIFIYNTLKEWIELRNMNISYSFDVFNNIFNACKSRNSISSIGAFDQYGSCAAISIVLFDYNKAYYFISGHNPNFNDGASLLLSSEAIKLASKRVDLFDFNGSEIEGIEHRNLILGGTQRLSVAVYKTTSTLLKFWDFYSSLKENSR
jgi:hypothetical protein